MVENITIFNNVLKSKLYLSATDSPFYILESVDWGVVGSKSNTYKNVNQIGETVENITLETRNISIIGWIIADTYEEMTSRKKMLNLFVNPTQDMIVQYDKYRLTFFPETSIQYGVSIEENNEVMTKFKISGICYNPLFREEFEEDVDAATTKGFFHFPLIINQEDQTPPQIIFGVREPSLITTIMNEGQVETGFKIIFVASSALKNPSLINVATQEFIRINKNLVAGERIEINTTKGERRIIGTLNGVTTSYAKYRDLDMSWLQLKIGENNFRYDAEENLDALDVFVHFSNKYLEVQECY